jgi:2-succinyl-5-enolpyruvyl-6-hydroxy-3-cyclohexene-1-carboxylate synthase
VRTFGLLGDLAFFHDLSALVRGTHEDVIDATIVVVDNSGGGIFSFLPYSAEIEPAVFERGFATPQSPDPGAVAEALGCRVTRVSSPGELVAALGDAAPPGVRVVIARTERGANAAVHAALETAVATAVDDALAPGR